MDRKKWAKALGALATIFAFIVLVYVLLLPKDQPLQVSTGLEKFPDDHRTLAQIRSGLSTTEINNLYLSLRRLESLDNLILVLAEEVDQGIINVPPEVSKNSDFFLIKTSDRDQLLNELKTQPDITLITRLSSQAQRGTKEPLTLWVKVLILVLGVLVAGTGFYLLRSVTRDLLKSWRGELQIIKYSGLTKLSVKAPLVLLSTGLGLAGSVLSVLLLFALSTWANSGIWIAQKLPGLLNNTSLLIITLWSLLLGVVLGFLASLSSLRVVDEAWKMDNIKNK
ncbi:hypothetical protein K9M06_02620 [Candidatus Bipolaricaulota bacterium]|nr:hypothetical protein [Candidatus Bipolaricaulota bacterium]